MNPLQQIPANVRAILYWTGYVVGVLTQGITIVWGAIAAASPDVTMPLGLIIASAVLGMLQTQLNLLSGSNVHAYAGEHRADEDGRASLTLTLVLALAAIGVAIYLLSHSILLALVIVLAGLVLLLLLERRRPTAATSTSLHLVPGHGIVEQPQSSSVAFGSTLTVNGGIGSVPGSRVTGPISISS